MAGKGRPKWEVTPDILKKVETLAAQGLTCEQVARSLGIGPTTFFERQKECPELKEAMDDGRAKGIATISNALFQKAKAGDNTAMIFYLKNRDPENWEDVQKRHISGPANGPVEVATVEYTIVDPQD